MAEKGFVTELKGELAVITMKRTEACAKCRACVAGLSEKDMVMEADNVCNAQVGDWVELDLIDNGFLFAVLIMYGIPFMGFMTGLLGGYYIVMPNILPNVNPDIPSFFMGMLLTALAYLWIRSQEHRWQAKKYRPVAKCVTTPDSDSEFMS